MPGRGNITAYHNRLAADVRRRLGARVTFYPLDDTRWYKARDGSAVDFDLVPVDPLTSEVALRMRREDGSTRRVSVFPLTSNSSWCLGTFWGSWHETWRKQGIQTFILLNAGWTVFEGLPGTIDKTQVLRVEWDQLPHKGSRQAGQPHWHFDHEVFLSWGREKTEVAPGLVEVNGEQDASVSKITSIGSIHLAMGAWNKERDHPECWQRTYENDCEELRDWSAKTLMYMKEQVDVG
jgi:hypothetical protein